jgi:undecaprenyl-diphosphatase
MLTEILLAIIQAATEFLPISSSGHLALFANVFSQPSLFYFTILHIASLLAVLIFTRKEIGKLLTFEKKYNKMWLYLIIGTIPAAFMGFFFKSFIETSMSSYLIIGSSFLFTSVLLFSTKYYSGNEKISYKSSIGVGLMQCFALLPGVSRSGTTISTARFFGINKEEAFKFSFLLFIPLSLGAMLLELGNFYFSWSLLISFFSCFFFSLLFLNLLYNILQKNKFWMFGFYCLFVGIVCLVIHFL